MVHKLIVGFITITCQVASHSFNHVIHDKMAVDLQSQLCKHSVKFFKDILSVQYQLQWQQMSFLQHIISGLVRLIRGTALSVG